MQNIRPEVRSFIASCECIHGLLAQGENLTTDEAEMLEMSTIDLLSKLRSPYPKPPAPQRGHAVPRH